MTGASTPVGAVWPKDTPFLRVKSDYEGSILPPLRLGDWVVRKPRYAKTIPWQKYEDTPVQITWRSRNTDRIRVFIPDPTFPQTTWDANRFDLIVASSIQPVSSQLSFDF